MNKHVCDVVSRLYGRSRTTNTGHVSESKANTEAGKDLLDSCFQVEILVYMYIDMHVYTSAYVCEYTYLYIHT